MRFEYLIALLGVVGLLLLFAGVRRLWRRRLLTGGSECASGALLIALALVLAGLALNLYTYNRLTYEQPVAELHIRAVAPQYYHVRLQEPGGEARLFDVRGDEWQLDARILKWHGYAVLLGLDTAYRLERLSGRYHQVEQERTAERTVYRLAEDPGLDLWAVAQRTRDWLPMVDTLYGSGAYMPLAEDARYLVSVSASGLVVRPANAAARAAVKDWR
jgi:hypothetical protein